ncbi:MAG: HAMP domain-containing protein [Deltaproteobacteria bacterium]|nr:HAMP domain-containing protein [Deltaproteobacteria bacterium]
MPDRPRHPVARRLVGFLFSIRTRLLLVNVLIVAVPILGIGFARFFEREMLRDLEQDMIHQAQVLRQTLLDDAAGLQLARRGPLLARIAAETRTRLRLLGADGALLADSHRHGPPEGPERSPPGYFGLTSTQERRVAIPSGEPAAIEDLADRPEVRRALAGRYGAATRLWLNGDRLFLFSALPIEAAGAVQGVVYVTRSTNPVRAALYRLRTTLFKVLAVSLAVTLLLSLLLAATISRPLTRLTRAGERIANGERGVTIRLERPDEIGQLARAFDTMTQRLDLRAQYVRQLAANISHEFKSPLTGIRGAAELLLEGAAADQEAAQRFLKNILGDANRLDRLVNRLLELARYEADTAAAESFDYEALVHDVAAQAHGAAPVEVAYRSQRRQVTGRRAHLASALGNLIENALQHAAPGTAVTVTVDDGPAGDLVTAVHNQGPPISAANLARIWDRFFTTRAEQGGSGLGLPIVLSVVTAHGGRVEVHSDVDSGTRFAFALPARIARAG